MGFASSSNYIGHEYSGNEIEMGTKIYNKTGLSCFPCYFHQCPVLETCMESSGERELTDESMLIFLIETFHNASIFL